MKYSNFLVYTADLSMYKGMGYIYHILELMKNGSTVMNYILMNLNVNHLFFSRNSNNNISIQDLNIEQIDYIKNLGIIFGYKLSLVLYTTHYSEKISLELQFEIEKLHNLFL